MIKVVTALIKVNNKYLIEKHTTGDFNMFGKWLFNSRKVEQNKNEMHAIERELKEKFEIIIKFKELPNYTKK